MATGFFIGGVALESIFIYDSSGAQSDDSVGLKVNGLDLSKYLYNCSSNAYASGFKKNGVDIGTLYCTSGCNAVCTGTCSSGCSGCTMTCADNCTTNCDDSCTGM